MWRFDRRRANGVLGDLGSHMIDLARWYGGDIVSVKLNELAPDHDEGEEKKISAGLDKVKEAIKGDDTEKIKKASEELTQASHKLAEAIYQQAAAEREKEKKEEPPEQKPGKEAKEEKGKKEDVVDAEYKVEDEEDEKKK